MDTSHKNRALVSAKKLEYSREYKKLKLQEEFLEKSLASTIKNMKIDADLIRQIADDHTRALAQRRPNIQETIKAAVDLVEELKCLKSILQGADTSGIQNLDVSDCGLRLTKLSNKIENLKSDKSGFETLTKEEETLSSELREFERTIFTEKSKTIAKIINERKCPTRNEVNDEFTELVARTGHTQGWTDEDHSLFLKTRKRCDSIPQLVTELKKRRAHLTNEEIVNHEAWHKLYTELREKRKREIAEWRSRNGSVKTNSNSAVPVSECSVKTVKTKRITEDRKKRDDVNGARSETKENPAEVDKKKMIEEWKAEKARKFAMDEEQKKRLEKAKLEEEKRRRDTKRSETIIKLRNYREEKGKTSSYGSGSTSRTNVKVGNQTSSSDSLRLIKSFREQDERFIKRRLRSLKVSRKTDSDEFSRRAAAAVKSRDYSTLFAPTKGWEEKCKREKSPDYIFGRVNYVKDIQRLSAPRWESET